MLITLRSTTCVLVTSSANRNPCPRYARSIMGSISDSIDSLNRNNSTLASSVGLLLSKELHLAIDVAKRTGTPLKIAGEVQPMYREYFENKIKPQIDGKLVEYIGLADLQGKNELL